jgi:hypothetical protein
VSTFSATPVFIRAFCLMNYGYAILFLGTKQPGRESRLIPTYKTRSALHLSPPYAFIVLCLCTGQHHICSCFNFRGIWLNASPVRAFWAFVCATVSLLAHDKHKKCCTLGLAFFDAVLWIYNEIQTRLSCFMHWSEKICHKDPTFGSEK